MNHLWYQEYKEKCGVGLLYIINLVFTIAFPAAFLLHLLLGWIKIISIPVSGLLVISCVLTTLMSLFSCIQNNMRVHGHPFVLVAKSENDGIDSFLLDLGAAALPLGVAYAELLTVINLMHVG